MPAPLTTTGTLDHCLLLSFRAPAEFAVPHLPRGLDLVTLQAQNTTWAFFNIVLCHISQMRPLHTPRALGLSYHHAAYRLMVQAPTASGTVRGLYFLRSDADNALITIGGNLLSDFRFHPARITTSHERGLLTYRVESRGRAADASVTVQDHQPPAHALNTDSVFDSPEQARAFLKYQPLGLCPVRDGKRIRLAEVLRDESGWREDPITPAEVRLPYLDQLSNNQAVLELATRLAPIDYRWRLGRSVAIAQRS